METAVPSAAGDVRDGACYNRPMDRLADDVAAYLRRRNMRVTDARRHIVAVALSMQGHFTADELFDAARKRGTRVSRASVYRTLALLCDGKFLESREFQRGQLSYEVMVDADHHDHLICTGCDRIVEFECEEIERLQDAVAAQHGFVLDHHSLRLFGRCADCR